MLPVFLSAETDIYIIHHPVNLPLAIKAKSAACSAADSAINKRKGKMKMKKLFIDSNYSGKL